MGNTSTMVDKKAMSFNEITSIYEHLVKTMNLLQYANTELSEAFDEISSRVLDLKEDLKIYESKYMKGNYH